MKALPPTPKGISIKSCRHGHGIFAKKKFDIGQRIGIIIGGKVVKNSSGASMFALKIPRKKAWWDEIDPGNPGWDSFLDHNDKANARILFQNFHPKRPRARLVAIDAIAKNDEITINYREYGDRLYKRKERILS